MQTIHFYLDQIVSYPKAWSESSKGGGRAGALSNSVDELWLYTTFWPKNKPGTGYSLC